MNNIEEMKKELLENMWENEEEAEKVAQQIIEVKDLPEEKRKEIENLQNEIKDLEKKADEAIKASGFKANRDLISKIGEKKAERYNLIYEA